jgi:hypothetical protein
MISREDGRVALESAAGGRGPGQSAAPARRHRRVHAVRARGVARRRDHAADVRGAATQTVARPADGLSRISTGRIERRPQSPRGGTCAWKRGGRAWEWGTRTPPAAGGFRQTVDRLLPPIPFRGPHYPGHSRAGFFPLSCIAPLKFRATSPSRALRARSLSPAARRDLRRDRVPASLRCTRACASSPGRLENDERDPRAAGFFEARQRARARSRPAPAARRARAERPSTARGSA